MQTGIATTTGVLARLRRARFYGLVVAGALAMCGVALVADDGAATTVVRPEYKLIGGGKAFGLNLNEAKTTSGKGYYSPVFDAQLPYILMTDGGASTNVACYKHTGDRIAHATTSGRTDAGVILNDYAASATPDSDGKYGEASFTFSLLQPGVNYWSYHYVEFERVDEAFDGTGIDPASAGPKSVVLVRDKDFSLGDGWTNTEENLDFAALGWAVDAVANTISYTGAVGTTGQNDTTLVTANAPATDYAIQLAYPTAGFSGRIDKFAATEGADFAHTVPIVSGSNTQIALRHCNPIPNAPEIAAGIMCPSRVARARYWFGQ